MNQGEIRLGPGDTILIRREPSEGLAARTSTVPVSIRNSEERITSEEFRRTEKVISHDFRTILRGRPLAKGRNLFFTDRSSRQYWIELDGNNSIKYIITDSAGVSSEPIISTVTDPVEDKCFIKTTGNGGPTVLHPIPCDEIVIVHE